MSDLAYNIAAKAVMDWIDADQNRRRLIGCTPSMVSGVAISAILADKRIAVVHLPEMEPAGKDTAVHLHGLPECNVKSHDDSAWAIVQDGLIHFEGNAQWVSGDNLKPDAARNLAAALLAAANAAEATR